MNAANGVMKKDWDSRFRAKNPIDVTPVFETV